MNQQSTIKRGNPHRVSHKPHHHATRRELPNLARYCVGIEARSGEPFDLQFSADGKKIVWLRPLTAKGRALLPQERLFDWANSRAHWWLDPPQQKRSN